MNSCKPRCFTVKLKNQVKVGKQNQRNLCFVELHLWEKKTQCGILRLCLVAQSCPTLCNPIDCSPPGSSVHGDSPGKILEWVKMPVSRGSSQSRDQTQISHIAGGFFTIWATGKPLNTRTFCFCKYPWVCTQVCAWVLSGGSVEFWIRSNNIVFKWTKISAQNNFNNSISWKVIELNLNIFKLPCYHGQFHWAQLSEWLLGKPEPLNTTIDETQ